MNKLSEIGAVRERSKKAGVVFIWEETRAEKEGRSVGEEAAWEKEADKRDRLVMCEMLVFTFF